MPVRCKEILVLNNNYQPLHIASRKRALVMLYLGKAHQITPNLSVIRLNYHVRKPFSHRPLDHPTRKGILQRDGYRCAYCGDTRGDMTIDHIQPSSRKGQHTWENLVCCCAKCNNHKGNRTPEEAGMALHVKPTRPSGLPFIPLAAILLARDRPEWQDYLSPYLPQGQWVE